MAFLYYPSQFERLIERQISKLNDRPRSNLEIRYYGDPVLDVDAQLTEFRITRDGTIPTRKNGEILFFQYNRYIGGDDVLIGRRSNEEDISAGSLSGILLTHLVNNDNIFREWIDFYEPSNASLKNRLFTVHWSEREKVFDLEVLETPNNFTLTPGLVRMGIERESKDHESHYNDFSIREGTRMLQEVLNSCSNYALKKYVPARNQRR